MALFDIWTTIQTMSEENFQELRNLARTDVFSVVASGVNDDHCLQRVTRELRKMRLGGFPRHGEAKSETRLAVQAITSRIVSSTVRAV